MAVSPVAVTLVGSASYESLCGAAAGQFTCVLSDGSHVDASEYFRTLGLGVKQWWSDCDLFIIANGAPDPLVQMGNVWDDHCNQLAGPVTSDFVGTYHDNKDFVVQGNEPTGLGAGPIPGRFRHPSAPGVALYGVGNYVFEKSNMFFNNDGAMGFWCGSQLIAIAWSLDRTSGNVAVTADLTAYQSDLETFYRQTVDKDQDTLHAASGHLSVSITANLMGTRWADYGTQGDVSTIVVSVRPI